jgi:hypothetical protein
MGGRLLAEARALRAAFPDVAAMRAVWVSGIPAASGEDAADSSDYRAACRYLRDEMLLVQAGKVTDLTVLEDEMTGVERRLGDDTATWAEQF